MAITTFDLYNLMERDKVLLAFKGTVTSDLLSSVFQIMESKMEDTVEYTRDIKGGLRDDILRIEQQADRTEDMVRKSVDDVRNMITDAESRFETKRDSLRETVNRDTKELEDRLMRKIQRALDNPLAN